MVKSYYLKMFELFVAVAKYRYRNRLPLRPRSKTGVDPLYLQPFQDPGLKPENRTLKPWS
jgi:hypothetical protein